MRCFVFLVFIIGSAVMAWSEPVEWPVDQGGNGHYYEVFGGIGTAFDGVTWTVANELANAMSFQGVSGHLVVLTSTAEDQFVDLLPGISCDLFDGPPCVDWHVGGWTIVTGVIDPQPHNPPYVETAADQWVTGEGGTEGIPPVSSVTGPVGEAIYYKLGLYSLDGFGYPDYGVHAVTDPSTAVGFVVEYDGLTAYNFPDGFVSTENVNWGGIKALYR